MTPPNVLVLVPKAAVKLTLGAKPIGALLGIRVRDVYVRRDSPFDLVLRTHSWRNDLGLHFQNI